MTKIDIQNKKDIGFYKDIIDCIQDRVDIIVKDKYSSDPCYPEFKVSILWLNNKKQQILLNCTHLERTFSRVLFPVEKNFYSYDWLGDVVESLYNQTM